MIKAPGRSREFPNTEVAKKKAEKVEQVERWSAQPLNLPWINAFAPDAPRSVEPPSSRSVVTKDEVGAASKIVEALAEDPELAEVMGPAAEALAKAEKILTAPPPFNQIGKKELIDGRIERRTRKNGYQKVTFRPYDPAVLPFSLKPAQVEGLPSGARATVELWKTEDGDTHHRVRAPEREYARSVVAEIVVEDGRSYARPLGQRRLFDRIPIDGDELPGATIIADVVKTAAGFVARPREELGHAGLEASFLVAATDAGLSLEFPADVMTEVEDLIANPGIRELKAKNDFTHIPFVTIDRPSTMDLDQAVHVERRDRGFRLRYAIADVSHFVKEGTALDREARHRQFTAYLPDRTLPVLPHALSEDLCSLVPGSDRRAFIVTLDIDANGEVTNRSFERGVIRSRAKLSFDDVQGYVGGSHAFDGREFAPSLLALRALGEVGVAASKARGVVPSDDAVEEVFQDGDRYRAEKRTRLPVEDWNEQVTLFVSAEVGRFIEDRGMSVLFRTHPEVEPYKLDILRRQLFALGVPWKDDVTLSSYVRGLDPDDVKTTCIQRLVTSTNRRAKYLPDPLGHAGLKLQHYVHFTAPMRRYPDVIVHRVLAALVENRPPPHQSRDFLDHLALMTEGAKSRNGEAMGRILELTKAHMFAPDVGKPLAGTVLSVEPSGFWVNVDRRNASIFVKAPFGTELGEDGVSIEGKAGAWRIGDRVSVVVERSDPDHGEMDVVPEDLHAKAAA
jgi:VacB/RNase II family 3'-5' exoribonuclease